MGPFLEVLIGGLLAGVLYSLVALGFVLIFKASGVFNFAQGAMVLFAALSLVRLMSDGLTIGHYVGAAVILGLALGYLALLGWRRAKPQAPPAPQARWTTLIAFAALGGALAALYGAKGWSGWVAVPAAAAIMGLLAIAIERLVLRPLVNQEPIILFMSTIGIAFFLDGFAQTIWGSEIYTLDLGIPKDPLFLLESVFEGGILVNKLDIFAAVIAGVLVAVLAVFFQRTRIGRALRAVADDHQAAQSVGIPLNQIWIIVWTVAGFVALVAGIVWGSALGVQFSIALVALKALPVLILGGLTSVPGAIIGGLLIGMGEKLSEVYFGSIIEATVGGVVAALSLSPDLVPAAGTFRGIENWFAYMLALVVLLFRPQGLFGDRIIERI
jgi:branched-chain amino acid transport system permease protein